MQDLASIRPARPDESAALTALALASKAHWGYDEAFIRACAPELHIGAEQIERHCCSVLELAGQLLGFYLLIALSAQEAELDSLFVLPQAIGRGYGKRLLAHALEAARRAGQRRVLIHADPNAVPFYRSQGAVVIGSRRSASTGRELPLMRLDLML